MKSRRPFLGKAVLKVSFVIEKPMMDVVSSAGCKGNFFSDCSVASSVCEIICEEFERCAVVV